MAFNFGLFQIHVLTSVSLLQELYFLNLTKKSLINYLQILENKKVVYIDEYLVHLILYLVYIIFRLKFLLSYFYGDSFDMDKTFTILKLELKFSNLRKL